MAENPVLGAHAGENGGLHVIAAGFLQNLLTTQRHIYASGTRLGHKAQIALQLARRIDRAHLRARRQRVAHAQGCRGLGQHFDKLIMHATLHQQARSGHADLARVSKNTHGADLRGLCQIGGIVKHDIGRFAPQL